MKNYIYIAGPMAGLKGLNKASFDCAAAYLREQGHVVFNPAELPLGWDYNDYMTVCFAMISRCDAMVMLPGWNNSKGALLERRCADKLKLKFCTERLRPIQFELTHLYAEACQ